HAAVRFHTGAAGRRGSISMRAATLLRVAAVAAVSGALQLGTAGAAANSVLIQDATVHTLTAAGVLEHTDVLISDGRIAAVGKGLGAPAGTEVMRAAGKPVTPGLFGGFSHLGIEEIGLESTQNDYSLKAGSMRPEFDVTRAFNPDSVILGVGRVAGI